MSSAHRPTWDPAKGRADERHKSARVSAREMPAHTKLKFRQAVSRPSTNTTSIVSEGGRKEDASSSANFRRDLKRDLELAEREHVNKKRRELGLAPLLKQDRQDDAVANQDDTNTERDTDARRHRMIEQLKKEMDADDDSSDDDQPRPSAAKEEDEVALSDSSVSDDDDDDDEEDETAALLRELDKIKRERAEEKTRLERERAELTELSREEEIALGNPLLNLENALRRDASGSRGVGSGPASTEGGFGVKRRWDDDVIFKNQATGNGSSNSKAGFVNDLTRSEFHKRFMQRYVQ